ncbi:MAG: phosphatase PAP2 family protein [Alphaproteobacteria bacterium]|nr:phosphatase PAP2 family protein [Alphaproteobacteria bacterium]
MLLWSGIALLLGGLLSFTVDRRVVHFLHAVVDRRMEIAIWRTTDWAKGAHWLILSILAYGVSWAGTRLLGPSDILRDMRLSSLAFLISLGTGSIILHTLKTLLGRRRPRDELELGLYGFQPFRMNFKSDSFPSGHALTIFCAAVILSGTVPALTPIWFAIALYLAMTRALLNAHFLSDVFIGSGIGLLTARQIIIWLFPSLTQPWF